MATCFRELELGLSTALNRLRDGQLSWDQCYAFTRDLVVSVDRISTCSTILTAVIDGSLPGCAIPLGPEQPSLGCPGPAFSAPASVLRG